MLSLRFAAAAAFLVFAQRSLPAGDFPQPFNTESASTSPMPPAQVVAGLQMPPGFHATVFAAEPDVCQPIAMVTDARGRLWVAENYTYAESKVGYEMRLRDRIVIFEDTDNDGHFDKRTVFWDGAQRLTSIEIGAGGVYALCLPDLLFIPDANGDDLPDGPPQVVLDGFDTKGHHTMANGLRWGPDGWLYGRQGILTYSSVGAPGTPEAERVPMNVGIWRYHPRRKVFEVVAQGTTNPWGMDWDQYGEAFFINTVIGHLWHVIPGAHYRRMTGDDLDPRIYDIIEQHADHFHWATKEDWTDVRKGVSDATLEAGGGHAHTGLLIYQGGQWPPEWSGKLLTINFHGRRFNVERLEREGTGYMGRREPEQFLFPDPWFRGIDLIAAPDGGIFVSDWSDTGECHDHDGVHRTSGRIYKITYGERRAVLADLNQASGAALAKLQSSENDWLARQARRVLANRAALGQPPEDAIQELMRMEAAETAAVPKLRVLWALQAMGRSDVGALRAALDHENEHLRAWGWRLLEDLRGAGDHASSNVWSEVQELLPSRAAHEQSGLVRLTMASLLQKLPIAARAPLAAALLAHREDDTDHNQPQMIWAGIMPMAEAPGSGFPQLIAEAALPRVQRYGARRLAELSEKSNGLDELLTRVAENGSPEARQAVLEGMAEGFSGRRQAPKPKAWDAVQARLAVGAGPAAADRVRELSALFGDGLALEQLRAVALKKENSVRQRLAALQVLVEAKSPGLRETCEALLPERELTLPAAKGLGLFDDPALAAKLVAAWPLVGGQERTALLNVLVSRLAWAPQVLDAVSGGLIERDRINASVLRQLRGYQVPELTRRIDRMFGATLDAAANNKALTAKWKARLGTSAIAAADRAHGRQVFLMTCGACHTLNGEGGAIGPDLTGAARDNLDYLLENILYPSAVVPDEFRQVTLKLKDGRVVAGAVKARGEQTVRVQTNSELMTLPASEIVSEEGSALSLMPEGLLEVLPEPDVVALFAYLMTK